MYHGGVIVIYKGIFLGDWVSVGFGLVCWGCFMRVRFFFPFGIYFRMSKNEI